MMDQEKKKLVENYVAMCVARGIDANRARKYAEDYYGVSSATGVTAKVPEVSGVTKVNSVNSNISKTSKEKLSTDALKNLEFKEKEISISSSSSSGRIRDKLNKFGKDFWRPIYGTVVLQPLAVGWALATETTANTFTDIYWSNLGPFTIIATVFLMPAYALYERIYPRS